MKNALITNGPLTVHISASIQDFMYYSSGIYDNVNCKSLQIDHAVVIVGYGTDISTGLDYWLVRNSWGNFFLSVKINK
jgi:C1A family cysteine protease